MSDVRRHRPHRWWRRTSDTWTRRTPDPQEDAEVARVLNAIVSGGRHSLDLDERRQAWALVATEPIDVSKFFAQEGNR